MRRTILRAARILLFAWVLLGFAAPAVAADPKSKPSAAAKEQASGHFRAGVGFYKNGDFTAALVEFKRAYELEPNYRVLFNLGQTSQELNDYAAALSAFERYLEEGGKEIDAARRAKVDGWVRELVKKVARVTIETNVEGAEILIDDVPVGHAPLDAPVLVNAGRRKFAATAPGHTPTTRAVEVAGKDERTVKLELVEVKAKEDPRPDPRPPPPPPPKETEIPAAAWVMLSVTGASAIVTGVMGGLALSARGGLDDELGRFPGNAAAIADAQGETKRFAIATDVMGAVTILSAATTGIIFGVALTSGGGESEEKKADVSAGVGPAGFALRGRF